MSYELQWYILLLTARLLYFCHRQMTDDESNTLPVIASPPGVGVNGLWDSVPGPEKQQRSQLRNNSAVG
jgi:hypothetical protein